MKGWRTILFNVLIIKAGVFAYLDAAGLKSLLPPGYAWAPILVGILNIVLRIVTTTPVGRSQ